MRISDWISDVCSSVLQYDTPENILAAPANDFVADFVGAGSTLKQLSLTRVRSLELGKPTKEHDDDDTGPVLARAGEAGDRKSVGEGKSVSVSIGIGGRRRLKKKRNITCR